MPYYLGGIGEGTGYMEVDDEGCYGHPVQQHTYVSVVAQSVLPPRPARQEHAPYVQPVNEALLQRLEQAGQPVPAMAAFLQDSLAIIVIEGLLDQIKTMKRQRVTALEHIRCTGKHKAPAYKEPVVEPKQARAPLDLPAVVENSLAELLLEPCDEIIADAPAMQQGWRAEVPHAPVMGSQAGPSSQGEVPLAPEKPELKAQPVAVESHGLSASLHAPDVSGPTKHCRGREPPLDLSKLDVMDFPNNFAVVILTTDPRTPEQYNGLVATQQKTAAASKRKGKAVATIKDESDYGQFSSEDKQKLEEGESAAQCFQHVQRNKKLAMKKANVVKAEAA
ncbi:hypothetical protein C0995_005683 [Termitomyces sp. Mi166|nr:hypothetical protein C0995_005683 [Termitomyces sp. Mi166\